MATPDENSKYKIVIRFLTACLKDGFNDEIRISCTYDEMMRILKILADDFPPFPIDISIYKPNNPNCYATCQDLAQLNTIIGQEEYITSLIGQEDYITSLLSKVNAILYPSETDDRE